MSNQNTQANTPHIIKVRPIKIAKTNGTPRPAKGPGCRPTDEV